MEARAAQLRAAGLEPIETAGEDGPPNDAFVRAREIQERLKQNATERRN